MPEPQDQIDPPVQNPDGSTMVKTTKFHRNGNKKKEIKDTRDRDGNRTETHETDYDDRGRKERETKETFDGEGRRDDRVETEFKSNGKKISEKAETFDDEGRLDERTDTSFDSNENPKERLKSEFDDQGRSTRVTRQKFRNNRKQTEQRTEFDYNNRPPKKTVYSEKLCPDGEKVRIRLTQVFYKNERNWREEKRARKKEKFDCETGEKIAFNPLERPLGIGSLLLAFVSLILVVLSWVNESSSSYSLTAYFILIIAGISYARLESQRRAALLEIQDFALSLHTDNEAAEEKSSEPKEQTE